MRSMSKLMCSRIHATNVIKVASATDPSRLLHTSPGNMGKLSGKVAVVTASTEGIGFAIAKKLGIDGAKVMISSRKQANVDRAVKELKSRNIGVCGTVCHVGKKEQRDALLKKTKDEFGGIDILVSNAAVNPYFGTLVDTPESAYDKIMEVNVKATFHLIQETVPYMRERGKGSIVIVSSIGGLVPFNMLGVYSISKTALLGMTKAFASELATEDIRVNALAPGIIRTKFSSALWESPEQEENVRTTVPMKRLGEPDECAGIVSFLSSDEASYVTGENMVVAGGTHSRL